MRLNAYLARAGVASRRGADALIKRGRVSINGHLGQLNSRVKVGDSVKLDGHPLQAQSPRYILLYKPAGTVTTLKDPEGRLKVTDLVKIPQRVVPVGRLDFNTTGALLLTNDGELAHRLMHPSFGVNKVYEAEVKGDITPKMLDLLSNSIQLDDGPTAPAKARILKGTTLSKGRTLIELTIHEGHKHQVKRMLSAVNLPVQKLHRSKYGPLDLKGLKSGHWRDLTKQELSQLKQR
ncbi:MAG: pseudouridine synthase [Patescibacteria group bacterium]